MADPSDPQDSYSPSPGASPAELTPPFPVRNEASSPGTPGTGRGGWQPPEPEQLQASFPQYEIRGILGRGGMGAVYLGWQRSLDRQVAIKILPPQLDDFDANFAERFKREAKAMARFSHPGIVAVHDAGETPEGLLYIVMEYIEGTDVQKMVRENGPLPPEHALAITAHVCDALAYAHQRGVIHRDIKPSNIMVDAEGRVKVADFGLAKLASDDGVSGMTGSDLRMGTPDFIAPEAMLMGIANVDQRADLYAVGVMLYQMLTGKVPRGMFEMPSIKRPEVDPRFDEIVARAMQNDPEKRYGSATEIRTDLDKILSEPVPHRSAVEQAPPPPAEPPPAAPQRAATVPKAQTPQAKPAAKALLPGRGAKKPKTGLYAGVAACVLVLVVAAIVWAKQSKPTGGPRSVRDGGGDSRGLVDGRAAARTSAGAGEGKAGDDKASPSNGSPAAATKDAPFVNSLGMKFVPVPITGGATKGERVLFSVWPTRVADYAAYAAEQEEAGRKVDGSWKSANKDGVPTGRELDHPVVNVNWEDAQAFCAWLTTKDQSLGRLPHGMRYRLPSDEEWSWAVGLPAEAGATPQEKSGKNDVDFPWGKEWPPTKKVGNYADETLHAKFPVKRNEQENRDENLWMEGYTDGYATTSPVGSFPANAYGLHDMGGNVWQWCEDWWNAEHKDRVLRGASWFNSETHALRSSHRAHVPATSDHSNRGFRCVIAPESGLAKTNSIAAVSRLGTMPATPTTPMPTAAATPKPENEIEKWLVQVDGIYQPRWQKEVSGPYASGLADLQKNYLAALDREIASASRAARLNDALAFRNERQRIEGEQDVPPDDSDSPPAALQTLRAAYRTQFARLEADRTKNAATVFEQYDKVLATNQAALTQRQRLDEALLLQQRRDALKQEWMAPPPVTPGMATKDRPFINTLGMKFVPVPGTNILMCIHETRRRDYAAYASETPKVDQMWKSRPRDGVAVGEGDDEPVTNMNWHDAEAFCAWLSKKEGRTYRPPTDREWSFAVGIGDREDWSDGVTPEMRGRKLAGEYPWGSQWPPPSGAGNYADTASKEKFPSSQFIEGYTDGFPTTSPVMSFPPNKLGIYDLGGGQWEWCGDWYNTEKTAHLLRGASWNDAGRTQLVVSYRLRLHDGSRGAWGNHGIRCVLVLTGMPAAPATEARPEPVRNPHPPAASPVLSPAPRATPVVAPAAPPSATPASRRPDPALGKATKDAPFTNTLGMKFVPVTGTKVLFCIHVTRRQDYAAYATETPGLDNRWTKSVWHEVPSGDKDDHPVVSVNWEEAQAFCAWLSKKEGKTYRLPTDQEWSYAVGIGPKERRTKDSTPASLSGKVEKEYPWYGTYPPRTRDRAGNFADTTAMKEFTEFPFGILEDYTDGFAATAPVFTFKPNRLGLYDMAGNVQQWCEDWSDATQERRVVRGSGFQSAGSLDLQSSWRYSWPTTFRNAYIGFRCVVELPAQ